ncbi:uncharacterized protein KY384_003012 [Bacidia gigantensis]|uniref:uncharacterized protein n=1 Tax=Bacidia gigantensis TaxID=2732470 RepID=UPI001D040893|nr:uncharacterized protein KY384_003012 [Bacidia gigantensis]KAG8531383.1 hypothetical protein KY384_003012 [Bacidia gigantensis]
MAYTDEAVSAKLSALNETQDAIVTVAQWVMFHKRNAPRTAEIWLQRLRDTASNKRLTLIYLANEIAQQSKTRKKPEFLTAFSTVIVEGITIAYRSASSEIQKKLQYVVDVWRQRNIFEPPIQEAVDTKLAELDKNRTSKKALGGSLFSSNSPSAPPEIQPLITLQINLSKATTTASTAAPTAKAEYAKLTDPSKPLPTPPVHAARLSALLKSLSSAESAVSESLKARHALISSLETLLASNKAAIVEEEAQQAELSARKDEIDRKKKEVEDGIMRGLSSADNSPTAGGSPEGQRSNGNGAGSPEPDRPDIEELTPPPEGPPDIVQALVGQPAPTPSPGRNENFTPTPAPLTPQPQQYQPVPQVGADLLSSLNVPGVRGYSGSPPGGAKRRKVDDESAVFGGEDVMAGLDDDVAELLRQESGGR